MDYIAIIHKEPGSCFGVSFPDFPGCISAGATLEEARLQAKEALEGHIRLMKEDKEPVPDPSSLDEVMKDPDFKSGVAFVVPVDTGVYVRINITLPEWKLEAIDKAAKEKGLSRSAYIAQTV